MATERERRDEAVRKTELILPLLDPKLTKKDRIALQKRIEKDSGLSYRTLSRYVETYRDGGFDAFIKEKQNRDFSRVINDDVVKKAIELRREQPERSISDIIMIMEMDGDVEKGSVKRSTLQRRMQEVGFSRRQMRKYCQPTTGKATRRFEKEHRMDMLQGDAKDGPYLPIGRNGEMVKTYFIGWIDDKSRYIVYGRFYDSNTARNVLDSMRSAVMRFGIPLRFYTDNGVQYIARIVKYACAILGVRRSRTGIRAAESKGKIENYNKQLDKFLAEAALEKFSTLEELNAYYEVWQDEYYHLHKHSSLGGTCPQTAFRSDDTPLRFVSEELLERAFMDTGERVVAKDGTISIDGSTYALDNLALVGMKVLYSRRFEDPDNIMIFREGFDPCHASPLVIGSDIDYEARNARMEYYKGKVDTDSSRLLRGLARSYREKHPDTTLHLERPETVREEEHSNFISYSSVEDNDD